MNESLQLRVACAGDADLVLAFIRELAEYEHLADEVVATREAIENTLFGPSPCAEVVIADWQAQPAGFALFFRDYSTFLARPGLYLEDLFVRPAHRGRGIGKALLAHLAGIAEERGYGRITWSVLDWNDPAIGFYRRIGARALDDWTQFRLDGPALARLAADR